MELNKVGLGKKKILAIVPHQDDELIGMGGFLAYACRHSAEVNLVLVTDGAADSGFLRVQGHCPCLCWADISSDISADIFSHDNILFSDKCGEYYHEESSGPIFKRFEDKDRATEFTCPAWGKQRDAEFLDVCNALGLKRNQINFAFWDINSPEHIKDGQVAVSGRKLSPEEMISRYKSVADHYVCQYNPDIILTVAPYEFQKAPNDHWAIAHAVKQTAESRQVQPSVFYHSTGAFYRHIFNGGKQPEFVKSVLLPDEIWEIKKAAIQCYFRWEPARGWFATAAHSVPYTFRAIVNAPVHVEYFISSLSENNYGTIA